VEEERSASIDKLFDQIEEKVGEKAREIADDVLDWLEDLAEKLPWGLGHTIFDPMIQKIRDRYNIPDNIGGDPD